MTELRVTLATLRCRFSSGGGGGAVSAPPCGMQPHSRTLRSWGLFGCLRRPALEGQPGYLLTWRFGPPICTLWRPSRYPQPHSTPRPGLRTYWTPPPPAPACDTGAYASPVSVASWPCTQSHWGGSSTWSGIASSSTRPPPPSPSAGYVAPPGPRGEGGAFVTVNSSDSSGSEEGGGSTGVAPVGQDPPSPSEPTSGPQRPDVSSKVAVGREGIRGSGPLHSRSSKRGMGPLEWWAVPCVYRRARLARRWRWVLQRRGAGLLPLGSVWLGELEWPSRSRNWRASEAQKDRPEGRADDELVGPRLG